MPSSITVLLGITVCIIASITVYPSPPKIIVSKGLLVRTWPSRCFSMDPVRAVKSDMAVVERRLLRARVWREMCACV
jgi:hypothetical protein